MHGGALHTLQANLQNTPKIFIKCIFCCSILHISSCIVSSLWARAFLEPEPDQLWHSLPFTGKSTAYHNTFIKCIFGCSIVQLHGELHMGQFFKPVQDQMWRSSPFTAKPTAYSNTYQMYFCCSILHISICMVSFILAHAFVDPVLDHPWHSSPFTGKSTA